MLYDTDSTKEELKEYTKECEYVFHLAGVNRPKEEKEFMEGNFGFTDELLSLLEEAGNKAGILITSSIQAALDNPYGISKKAGEDRMREYEKKTGAKVTIYRLPNVFGKWCHPNYNSAVATFCNNIARGLEIKVNDPEVMMHLVYIDDVVSELIDACEGKPHIGADGFGYVPCVYDVKLGEIPKLLYSYKESRSNFKVPKIATEFENKLYATYLSYLEADDFSYPLVMHSDDRGSFTEILKSEGCGQVSVNIIKPGITKGEHWHNTKNEKFLCISGEISVKFRKIGDDKIYEYKADGTNLQVIDIPTGYTHNISNIGTQDAAVIMWANEVFNPDKPDTYFEKVNLE